MKMFVNGDWVDRASSSPVEDPESSNVIGSVPVGTVGDVDKAVAAGVTAMKTRFPTHKRAEVLRKSVELLSERAEEAALTIAREGIKTIREARGEVRRCINTLTLCASESLRLGTESLAFDQVESGERRMGFVLREPLGVIAAITPFNDPLNLVAHKVGPALAAGNAVIVKPDSKTPLSALFLASLIDEAGVPTGYLQVVTGPGSVLGRRLVEHPDVRMVSFTGGTEVGEDISMRVGLKKVVMELGANSGVIVMDDADIEGAASACVGGAFGAAGQNCLHVQRIFIQDAVYDAFVDVFLAKARSIRTGPKLDESTDMGPLISLASASRVADMVEEARDAGASILLGGRHQGALWEPTVVADVPNWCRLNREEVYGPVTVVAPFSDVARAIDLVNDTDYGLHGAVFTRDLDTAFEVATRLECGGVMINDSTDYRIDAMPFGGRKRSGLGKEGVASAIEAMTEQKVVCFNNVLPATS